jgi:hypothetical protein
MIHFSFCIVTQRFVFVGRRFGVPCWLHLLGRSRGWSQQGVSKRRSINTTSWVVTQTLELIIQTMAKAWNLEQDRGQDRTKCSWQCNGIRAEELKNS